MAGHAGLIKINSCYPIDPTHKWQGHLVPGDINLKAIPYEYSKVPSRGSSTIYSRGIPRQQLVPSDFAMHRAEQATNRNHLDFVRSIDKF